MYLYYFCSIGLSSKPSSGDVIGIDLGTTNSCVSVMEGKVRFFFNFMLYWNGKLDSVFVFRVYFFKMVVYLTLLVFFFMLLCSDSQGY